MNEDSRYICTACYFNHVETRRAQMQIEKKLKLTCSPCGEVIAKDVKHTVAPINKSNYMYISDPQMLKQLNPKRTT